MLLYSHTENGERIDGDKAALLAYIRGGGDVKVGFFDEKQNRTTIVAPIVTFIRYDDAFAQVGWIVCDWIEPNRDLLQFYDPPTSFTLNISTTGATHRRIVDSSEKVGVDVLRLAAQWFKD